MVKTSEVSAAKKHADVKATKTISKVAKSDKKEKSTASDRKKKQLARRFSKLQIKHDKQNVLYIGHLPKGFNESEIKQFFAQFGSVSKLRVARSKKTARNKGYCFLQFEDSATAKIASTAMQGYMMFGRVLDVHIMENPHQDMFKHGNRDWSFIPTQLMFRNKKNAEEENRTEEQRKGRVEGLLQKEKEKRDRLKELQIDYEFPGFSALVKSTSSKKSAPVQAKKSEKAPVVVAAPVKAAVVAQKQKTPEPVKESRSKSKTEDKKAPVVVAAPVKSDSKHTKKPVAEVKVEVKETRSKDKKVEKVNEKSSSKKEAVKPVQAASKSSKKPEPVAVVKSSKDKKTEKKPDNKVAEKSKSITRDTRSRK